MTEIIVKECRFSHKSIHLIFSVESNSILSVNANILALGE